MTETAGGPEGEPDPGHDGEDGGGDDPLGHRDADQEPDQDESGGQSDQDAGSSPAW